MTAPGDLQPLGVDGDQLLLDIIKPAMPDGVQVEEPIPADLTSRYPFVRAFRPAASGAAVDPRWLEIMRAEVDVFDSDKTNALYLARLCRAALFRAWTEQLVFPNGSVSSYKEDAAPAEFRLPIQPDGQYRIQAIYLLGVCPPA